jgi:hypothetical protein
MDAFIAKHNFTQYPAQDETEPPRSGPPGMNSMASLATVEAATLSSSEAENDGDGGGRSAISSCEEETKMRNDSAKERRETANTRLGPHNRKESKGSTFLLLRGAVAQLTVGVVTVHSRGVATAEEGPETSAPGTILLDGNTALVARVALVLVEIRRVRILLRKVSTKRKLP